MASFAKCVTRFSETWQATPVEKRDQIIRNLTAQFQLGMEMATLIPAELMETAKNVVLAALPKLMLGTDIEALLIDASKAIPELSPYVRQLLGD